MYLKEGQFLYGLLFAMLFNLPTYGQVSNIPVKVIELNHFETANSRERKGQFEAIGEVVPINEDVLLEANSQEADGMVEYFLAYHAPNAKGINFYFENISLPKGSTFYLKGNYRGQTLQLPLKPTEKRKELATGFIYGDYAELHIKIPNTKLEEATILLEGVGVTDQQILPRDIRKDFGSAASCNVNIRCDEGGLWQDIGRSVVRILVRNGNFVGWCSGVLVNNTSEDFTPYILTAQHCGLNENTGNIIPQSNFDQWVFYFNYEVDGCTGSFSPINLPQNIMAGADLIAHSDDLGGDLGSDFLLLELQNSIPANFNPVFAGWSNREVNASAGVAIHHPQGDVKKISTYTTQLESSQFSSESSIRNTHWKVFWDETPNGFGITEAGSSGAPLFNNAGQIIGNLTGGLASCNRTDGFDLFGKVSYHWFSNGDELENQLAPWLDPLELDALAWRSVDYSGNLVTGTEEEISLNSLEISPNPSQGRFNLSLPGHTLSSSFNIKVIDRTGKVVFEQQLDYVDHNVSMNLGQLKAGLYFLTLNSAEKVYRQKILIR